MVICALVAAGILALAFAGDSDPDESLPAIGDGSAAGGARGAHVPEAALATVTEYADMGGLPIHITDFDPASDLMELDLDRASFGDVGAADLALVADPDTAATRVGVAGEVVAVVHGTRSLDSGRIRIFAV